MKFPEVLQSLSDQVDLNNDLQKQLDIFNENKNQDDACLFESDGPIDLTDPLSIFQNLQKKVVYICKMGCPFIGFPQLLCI